MEKSELDKKINTNVEKMYKNGWKQEVEAILKQDKNIAKLNALRAIGYSEIIDAINNDKEIDFDLIKQKTRQYAKRQITWIRTHYKDHILFTQNNYQEISKLLRNKLSV
jgi:tRNA dimethylallyltransferase